MKIAITHFNLTIESGDTRMVLSIAQALKSHGHKVVIYAAEFNPETCFPNLNHGLDVKTVGSISPLFSAQGAHTLWEKVIERFRRIKAYNSTAKLMLNNLGRDLDLIICENDYSYKAGSDYKKINPSCKVIWIMNNPPFFRSPKIGFLKDIASRLISAYERISAKKFGAGIDWIVVYDEATAKLARSLNRPVQVIGNPVDFEKFYQSPKKINPLEHPLRLLSVGALTPQRRFEDTIETVSILRKKGYNCLATIVCNDHWASQEYLAQFKSFVHESGVENFLNLKFSGANDEELVRLYKESDIFIFPSNIAIWGVSVFEAMAAGLPAIVSNVTDVAKALEENKHALFIPPLSPSSIAKNVLRLVEDAELCKMVSSEGQNLVREKFNLKNYAIFLTNLSLSTSKS